MKIKTITICASLSFYKAILPIEKELKNRGILLKLPDSYIKMKRSGDFTPQKPWQTNADAYKTKRALIDKHFKKIAAGDAILVINNEKNGINGYIGGNVLMEITLAYYLKKKIFLWNEIEKGAPFEEELRALNAKVINQDLDRIG